MDREPSLQAARVRLHRQHQGSDPEATRFRLNHFQKVSLKIRVTRNTEFLSKSRLPFLDLHSTVRRYEHSLRGRPYALS